MKADQDISKTESNLQPRLFGSNRRSFPIKIKTIRPSNEQVVHPFKDSQLKTEEEKTTTQKNNFGCVQVVEKKGLQADLGVISQTTTNF